MFALLRAAWPTVLGNLLRITGSLHDAEDALQGAACTALERWPVEGIPAAPAAWLLTVARNRFFDEQRHRKIVENASPRLEGVEEPSEDLEANIQDAVFAHDDLLRLMFTCCHPALPVAARLVLTLRAVAGLTVPEIASALLIDARAAEQRLTRAKRLVQELMIPYEVPARAELALRRDDVLRVIYLLFNEGYRASSGESLIRHELCRVALGLGANLCRALPNDPESQALLALMLLNNARSSARFNHTGEIVLLDRQDRRLWDREAILAGQALLDMALRHERPGPYQVQAAIAALHCDAASIEETDWEQIALLYRALGRMNPSPVVTVNRAVAIANAGGLTEGLALLDSLAQRREISGYAEFHGARGHLLERLGNPAEAAESYKRARGLTKHGPTARHLDRSIDRLLTSMSDLGSAGRQ